MKVENVRLSFEYECPDKKEIVQINDFPLEKTQLFGDSESTIYIEMEIQCPRCWEWHSVKFEYE